MVLLAAIVLSINCFAQTDTTTKKDSTDDMVFTVAQKPAEFSGGINGWNRYLEQNLNIGLGNTYIVVPKGQTQATATVVLSFVVNKKGKVLDVTAQSTIPENVHPELIKEAIRMLKNCPKWIPAKHNGTLVNYRHIQSISWQIFEE